MNAKTKVKLKNNLIGYALLTPFLIGLIFFTIYPLGLALFQSFFRDYNPLDGFDRAAFGLDNYKRALTDKWVLDSMKLTLTYAVITIPMNLVVSFFLSYLLTRGLKGSKAFRIIVYLPALIPGVVGASIYKYIFNSNDYGLLNSILISMNKTPSKFLEAKEQAVALWSFIATGFFSFGCSSPMWIAGFNSVQKDVYEAAMLDGSTAANTLFKITIPLMGKFIFFQLLGSLIGALQIGESVLMLSPGGGYNGNLNFYGLMIYNQTTGSGGFNYGFASALSYLLFMVIGALSAVTFRANKKIYYED